MNLHKIRVSQNISELPIDAQSPNYQPGQQYEFRSNSISTDGTVTNKQTTFCTDHIHIPNPEIGIGRSNR